MKSILKHDDLVEAAYKWLLKNGSCGFAFKELVCMSSEIPDVIGFGSGNHSVLIECKTSRSDYFADRKKFSRKNPDFGIGKYRLYCCPVDVIKIDELPPKWGLLYVNEKGKIISIMNPMKQNYMLRLDWAFTPYEQHERALMYSALRRLKLKGHLDSIYE